MKMLGYLFAMFIFTMALIDAGYATPGPVPKHGGPVGDMMVSNKNKGSTRQGTALKNGGLPTTPGKGSSSINGTGMQRSSSNINGTNLKVRR